ERDEHEIEEEALLLGRLASGQQEVEVLSEAQPPHQVAGEVAPAHFDPVGIGLADVAHWFSRLTDLHASGSLDPGTPGARALGSASLKPSLLVLSLITLLGLTACGSKKKAAPLALDQRVPTAQDAPGSKPDPVEKRVTVTGPDEFISRLGERFVNPTPQDGREVKSAGFVRAVHDTRFIPNEPGGPHTKNAVHIFSLVMQFRSADGAEKALELLHADSLRPCPSVCAFQISEIYPDVHGAQGVRRY